MLPLGNPTNELYDLQFYQTIWSGTQDVLERKNTYKTEYKEDKI